MLRRNFATYQPVGIRRFDNAYRLFAFCGKVTHLNRGTHALKGANEADTTRIEADVLNLNGATLLQEGSTNQKRRR